MSDQEMTRRQPVVGGAVAAAGVKGSATEPRSCTDCHAFAHRRFGYRTRRWDKRTGELLECDGVRM